MSTNLVGEFDSASIQRPRVAQAGETRISHQPADDSLLTRAAWMPTFDIDLRFMTGSSFVGAFPDERIPKRSLIFFRDGDAVSYRPKEIPALVTTEESVLEANMLPSADVIDTMGIQGRDESLRSCQTVRNSPRFCANTLSRQYAKVGMRVFEHLNGRDDVALRFYDIILPADAIPVTTRMRLNETFVGPFLDEVLVYLRTKSPANIKAKNWHGNEQMRSDCERMHREMLSGATTAWGYQNSVLNKTEQLIREKRNGGEGKEWYDQRDTRFEDSLPGQDVVFLADTKREPLDVQDVAAAAKLTQDTTASMMAGFEGLFQRLSGMAGGMQEVADPRYTAVEKKLDALLKMAKDRPDLQAAIAQEFRKVEAEAVAAVDDANTPPAPGAEEVVDPALNH